MGTFTSFLSLLKPAGTDFINEQTQLAENWDKVDVFAGNLEPRVDVLEASTTVNAAYGVLARTNDAVQNLNSGGVNHIPFDTLALAAGGFTADLATNHSLIVPVSGLYLCRYKFMMDCTAVANLTLTVSKANPVTDTGCVRALFVTAATGLTYPEFQAFARWTAGDEVNVRYTHTSGSGTNIRIGGSQSTGNFTGSGGDTANAYSAEFSMLFVAS